MMRTIGLIGGMSWESTAIYYRLMNQQVRDRVGGLRSMPVVLSSLDFSEVAARQRQGAWSELASMLASHARRLQAAGAQCILIATNTMHKVAPEVQDAIDVPLLHIADVTADRILRSDARRVCLLGTRFTMEQPFYVERMAARGIECIVPAPQDMDIVHGVIFDELCRGQVVPASRVALQDIVARVAASSRIDAVVLGCTELTMMLDATVLGFPVFDTTAEHAAAAVDFALRGTEREPSLAEP